ncbi:MAG: DUF3817 domain-containing protein [Leucobacter sp.]
MQLQPKPSDYPRIRKAVSFYKAASIITGVMLLLLVAVMVMKYAFNVQLFLGTPHGFAYFYPLEAIGSDFEPQGFDLFKAILIAHGWFYVVYLISDFLLWSPMRWGFGRFILIALGGVIPFMSFFLEAKIVREVLGFLDVREAELAAPAAPAAAQR